MSWLSSVLEGTERLDDFERRKLEEWLEFLQADCDEFGATPHDTRRMEQIKRRLREDKRK